MKSILSYGAIILAMVTLCAVGIALRVVRINLGGDPPSAETSRLERHCMFVRMTLEQELDNLFATDPQRKMVARLSFEQLESEDWREVALCAPEGTSIAQGCERGDVPCMAASITQALAAMGVR